MENTIWTFDTARFTVVVGYEYEQDPDLSWDDTGETAAKIDSGEWGNFCFHAKVYLGAEEIASTSLGNSIHANPSDFRDHVGIKQTDPRCGSYFSDMVREVLHDARIVLAERRALNGG